MVGTAIMNSTRAGRNNAQHPAQLMLCRIAVPTTPAQIVSWSIPITSTSNFTFKWCKHLQKLLWFHFIYKALANSNTDNKKLTILSPMSFYNSFSHKNIDKKVNNFLELERHKHKNSKQVCHRIVNHSTILHRPQPLKCENNTIFILSNTVIIFLMIFNHRAL